MSLIGWVQGPGGVCLVVGPLLRHHTVALALCPVGVIRVQPPLGDLLCSVGVFIAFLKALSLEMSVGNTF